MGGAAEGEAAVVDMVSNSLMEAEGLTAAAAAEAMAAAVAEETAVAADVAAMAAEDRLLNLTLIKHLS